MNGRRLIMGVDLNLNIVGFAMDGDNAVGMITDKGFTLQITDGDGNVLPLNKERIEQLMKNKEVDSDDNR